MGRECDMGINQRIIGVVGTRDEALVQAFLRDYLAAHSPPEWRFDLSGRPENADVIIEAIPYCNLSADQSAIWNTKANWHDGGPPFPAAPQTPDKTTTYVVATRYETFRPLNKLPALSSVPEANLSQSLDEDVRAIVGSRNGVPVIVLPTGTEAPEDRPWREQV